MEGLLVEVAIYDILNLSNNHNCFNNDCHNGILLINLIIILL